MKKYDVLILGDINPDIMMVDYARLPNPGEEVHVKKAYMELGGGAANCAAGLAKLNLKVAIYGFLGNDSFGQQLLLKLRELGISTDLICVRDDLSTGVSVALTNSEDRAFVTFEGANSEFDISKVPDEVIKQAKHVHALYYNETKNEMYQDFFKKVRSLGITSSFDIGYDVTETWNENIFDVVKYVDIFMPNEKESISYTRKQTAEEALEFMSKIGSTVVVKKGNNGSIGYRNGEFASSEPFLAKCVDTTGAGDAFNAGFIYGWLQNQSLEDCLTIGNATGSRSVQRYGGNPGFPYLEELKTFLKDTNINLGGI